MSRKNPTSVVLNETVQKIKDELAPIYGLKNILSAGLAIFGRLSADEQKKAIAEVNSPTQEDTEDKPKKTDGQVSRAMYVLKEMSADGLLHIEFLSDEDRKAAEELAELMRPETKAKKSDKGQTA